MQIVFFFTILAVALCAPEPKAKPGLVAAAYSAPLVAAPGLAAYSPYTAPFAYSAGYVASPYAAAYSAYPAYSAYSAYSAPLIVA